MTHLKWAYRAINLLTGSPIPLVSKYSIFNVYGHVQYFVSIFCHVLMPLKGKCYEYLISFCCPCPLHFSLHRCLVVLRTTCAGKDRVAERLNPLASIRFSNALNITYLTVWKPSLLQLDFQYLSPSICYVLPDLASEEEDFYIQRIWCLVERPAKNQFFVKSHQNSFLKH